MLDIIDAIKYPVVLLVVSVFALVFFREPISEFIGRLRSVGGPKGLQAGGAQPQQLTRKSPLTESFGSPKPGGQRPDMFSSVILHAQEQLILTELEKRKITDEKEMIDILVKYYAAEVLFAQCEMVYNTIFGSQIRLLQALNSGIHGPDVARVSHMTALESMEIKPEDYPLDEYMRFLITSGLVIREDDDYAITTFGQEFLRYLISTSKPLYRPN